MLDYSEDIQMKRIRVEKNWNVVITVERGSADNHRISIRRRVLREHGGDPNPWEQITSNEEIANGAANKKSYIFDGYPQVTEWEISPEYYYGDDSASRKWHSSYLKLENPHDGGKTIELVYEDHKRGDDYFDLLVVFKRDTN